MCLESTRLNITLCRSWNGFHWTALNIYIGRRVPKQGYLPFWSMVPCRKWAGVYKKIFFKNQLFTVSKSIWSNRSQVLSLPHSILIHIIIWKWDSDWSDNESRPLPAWNRESWVSFHHKNRSIWELAFQFRFYLMLHMHFETNRKISYSPYACWFHAGYSTLRSQVKLLHDHHRPYCQYFTW